MFWVFHYVSDSGAHALDDGILEGFFRGKPLRQLVVGCFGNIQGHTGHSIVDFHLGGRDESSGQDGLTLGIRSGVGREFRPLLVREQDRQQARRGDVLAQAGCLGPNIFLPREKVDSWVFLQRGEDFHGRFALGSIHGSRRGCVGGLIV